MYLSPALGWKPIPKNPIPIFVATTFTYKKLTYEVYYLVQ
jgi:hypothetical protein